MADESASGQSGRNMIEVAREMGDKLQETLQADPDTAYIIVAVDRNTCSVGWIATCDLQAVLEALGSIVASRRN